MIEAEPKNGADTKAEPVLGKFKDLGGFCVSSFSALGREINMNDIDIPIQWQEGRGESVEIGYFNPITASSAAVIAEFRGPIMDNMHTRPNVPSVAMCMEQMDPICMKGDVPNARKGLRG
ncbi:MAG: hypothetical protein U9M90_00535 [Patescibacteria group bacterium]|nr:hypothetical protein [Patescibacteria group bacterium]